MYYIIYKITNNINGKIYIGKHKTNNLDDGYMGSGKYIQNAVKKYGKENFTKEILFQFDTEQEMNDKEAEIVNEEFLHRDDTYNLALGGKGGDFTAANKRYKELMTDPQFREAIKQKQKQSLNTRECKLKRSKRLKEYYLTHTPPFLGKHHTVETKQRISESHKLKDYTGENNPTYGRIWIVHPEKLIEKQINPKDFNSYVQQGFIRGRVYTSEGVLKCSGTKCKKQGMSIQERTQIQKEKELKRINKYGKSHCFINKKTGRKKYFRDSELDTVDLTIWQATWLRYNINEIKQLKKDGMSWGQIAEHYNTTYWDIYSWYRDNKDKFKD